jgi:hypothetical protein
MLKRFTAFLLIAALLCSGFQWVMVYAGFQLNQKYIATTLCVNRNKPWMHCNGKCYFMRKLKQAQEKEKNEESQAQKNLIQQAFYSKPAPIKFHSYILQVIPIPNNRVILPEVYYPIFLPPKLG